MQIFSEQIRKEHILAKVDARVKLAVTLALLIMILSYRGNVFPLIVLFLNLILCIKMKIPIKVILLRFSEPLFIASMIVILKFFFAGGLREGLMIASRILGAVSVVITYGFSTSFNEIVAGLSWFKVPKSFIEILMFAYRYIFMLLEDAMVIYYAQKNRLGYSGIRRGLGSFGTLTGSLILKAFEHSQNITTAMIQRGYDGNIPIPKPKPFKVAEIFISFLFIVVMGVIWKI
ncbi:MAG: cobalt ECF transporter T component CbiQ [Nitrospirota bacterium]